MTRWIWSSTEIYGNNVAFFFKDSEGGNQDIHLTKKDAVRMVLHLLTNLLTVR